MGDTAIVGMMAKLTNPSAQSKPMAVRIGQPNSLCAACAIRDTAICSVLSDVEMQALQEIMTHVDLPARKALLYEGDEANFVYNVVGGTLRMSKLLADGRRQITGFLMAGDFVGFACDETYSFDVEAVCETRLCRFPVRQFEAVCESFPQLEKRLLREASNELAEAQDQMLLLGRQSPQERLAKFLLRLRHRLERAGQPADPLSLSMTRSDIADYLGLTIETVSRCFTRLRKDGLIALPEANIVVIKDLQALEQMTI